MRYNVHSPCAFRNRIARYLGVLVGAALVATLGLPSAAQAQSIANDGTGIVYADATGFAITWTTRLDTGGDGVDNWIVTVTKPDGTKVVVNEHSTVQTTLGAVATSDAEALGAGPPPGLTYKATDLGTWWFQVSACLDELAPATAVGKCPTGESEAGTSVGYTHGAPPAPTNLAANAVPTGVALTWTDLTSDRAISGYQYAFKTKADGKPDWKATTGKGAQVIKADPGEHTFMLRAVGRSDNSTATMEGASVPGAAASEMVTVGDGPVVDDEEDEDPVPTPTLPEIAALLLGTLLLGSGAYLLRGRQSGGLSQA